MSESPFDQATAGLRSSASGVGRSIRHEPVWFSAGRGAPQWGLLIGRGSERRVAIAMHPREFVPGNYLVPGLVDNGIAAFVQAPRSIGNDLKLIPEQAVGDVGAAARHLLDRGFDDIVLIGVSGGASTMTLYAQQALLPSHERIETTPIGRDARLRDAVLPAPTALALVSAHPGQGELLLRCLDPSVSDESDAFSTDPLLDPFSPANGFAVPPASSSYGTDFVAAYRTAQRARCARIDARAWEMIDRRRTAEMADDGEMSSIIEAAHEEVFSVWRTDADLRCFDLSLEPSDRRVGTLWGRNPFRSNYGPIGFARTCTPTSWLGNWSGLSSQASISRGAPDVTVPVVMIQYSGDASIFPSDFDDIAAAFTSTIVERHLLDGDHHGRPLGPDLPGGQASASRIAGEFFARATPASTTNNGEKTP